MQNNNFNQFPQNMQQPLQNPQKFPQNQPNEPQNQPLPPPPQNQQAFMNFQQNPQQFQNNIFNPNAFPPMTPEQQKILLEIEKKRAFETGKILAEQKRLMEQLKLGRTKREEYRKKGEMTLFFKYKPNELYSTAVNITADKMIPELLQKYINESGIENTNLKFRFKNEELKIDDQSGTQLYEIQGLVSGEEIIVEDN